MNNKSGKKIGIGILIAVPVSAVIKGIGLNKESNVEGFRIKNVFGTYVLGPILVFNPLFTKHILDLLGVKYKKLELESSPFRFLQRSDTPSRQCSTNNRDSP